MGWGFIGDVIDVGSDVVSGVGDFFSSGGGEAAKTLAGGPGAGGAISAYNAAQSSGAADLFSNAANFATGAFSWLGDPQNAQAANILGGVALGAGQYYSAEKDREAAAEQGRLDRELRRELLATELDSQMIAPGDRQVGGYVDNVTNGLISNGILASAIEGNR